MTTHICKDFLAESLTSTTVYLRYYALCLVSYFLKGVLGFSVIGHTNFDINNLAITKGSGTNNANVNLGVGYERAVQLPVSYTVSISDVGRVLALKSNSNPLLNSGLFRITGIDSATNCVFMAARSWLDEPPVETNISWTLFEHESIVTSTFLNGDNGLAVPNYKSEGTATTSRIILQSPHSSAWQVRICAETPADVDDGASQGHIGAACTIIPGFGGNSSGDFQRGGQHLHHAQFWGIGAKNNSRVVGTSPGIASISTAIPGRYYMWGDDVTGTCFIVIRQHGSLEAESIVSFGLPEDEEQPLPTLPVQRLFSYGSILKNVGSTSFLHIKSGPYTESLLQQMGTAFGFSMQPITCIASSWAYSTGQATNNGIMNSTVAADDAYMNATVLWSWDLIAGTYDNADDGMQSSYTPYMVLEPRRLGRMPFARRGRENYNQFSTSVDAGREWFHVSQGVYLPWSGSIVP